jgi:hypothetical protein
MKFAPGDLVIVIEGPTAGCVGSIRSLCSCFIAQLVRASKGFEFYEVTGLDEHCYREDILKKLDGYREPRTTEETKETECLS